MMKVKKLLLVALLGVTSIATVAGFVACGHEHAYTEEVTTAATCTADGVKTFTCECGDSYTEAIAKTGHTEEVLAAKEATCGETGLTEGKKCSECNEVLVAQNEVPATGAHTIDDGTVTKQATCTEAGEKTFKCTVCGEVMDTEVIEASHKWVEKEAAVAATCTKKGKEAVTWCEVCQTVDENSGAEIKALGHAGYGADGKCTACGEANPNVKTGNNIMVYASALFAEGTIGAEITTEVQIADGVWLVGGTDKKITVDQNGNKHADFGENFVNTHRIKLGGSASSKGRYVKVTTTGAATITIYAQSSSKDADRVLGMATDVGEIKNVVAAADGSNVALGAKVTKLVYTVDAAGTYYFGSTDGGMNLYAIGVTTSTAATTSLEATEAKGKEV